MPSNFRRRRNAAPDFEPLRWRPLAAVGQRTASAVVSLTHARIENGRELCWYIVRTSLVCAALAVAFDVANQLIFFESWHNALRSWTVSAVIATVIAIPVSLGVGRAYLDLYIAKSIVEQLSRIDPLTGLLNRRAFLDAAKGDVAALAIIDVDRFKRINDTYGHLGGDEVLRAVASAIRAELADIGAVGRVGGEEFALVSHDLPADVVAARVRRLGQTLSETAICAGGIVVNVTLSAGVAGARARQSFEQIYAEADCALYAAKAAGRNRVLLASPRVDEGDNLRPRRDSIVSAA